MLVSIHRPGPQEHVLRIRARAEGEDGMLGDFMEEVRPGESFLGWSYPELLALGNGMHNVVPKMAPRLWPGDN